MSEVHKQEATLKENVNHANVIFLA